jgi:glycosyltransferase involved in cell wall biosynthesis
MHHIAMVVQRYYPHVGGAENQIQQLAPRLRARGFEVCVLTRREPGLARFERINDTPVYRLPAFGPKAMAAATFTGSAVLQLGRLRPDLVHAHEILSPASVAVTSKRFLGHPVVVKLLRGGLLGDIYKLEHRPFGRQRFRGLCHDVDAFVVISREIENELAVRGVQQQKRMIIPNGVDTDVFAPASESEKKSIRTELRLPEQALLVVYVGRLVAEKRVDSLLRLWNDLRIEIPDAFLAIVGSGVEEDRLKEIPAAGVQFVGQSGDTARYLRAADLFVLPSSTEGLSVSLLEAMSTGLPVLATSVGGSQDVIQHESNGYLIAPDKPEELRQGLQALLKNPERRKRLGLNARLRIISNYSLNLDADRLAALYARLLAESQLRV